MSDPIDTPEHTRIPILSRRECAEYIQSYINGDDQYLRTRQISTHSRVAFAKHLGWPRAKLDMFVIWRWKADITKADVRQVSTAIYYLRAGRLRRIQDGPRRGDYALFPEPDATAKALPSRLARITITDSGPRIGVRPWQ